MGISDLEEIEEFSLLASRDRGNRFIHLFQKKDQLYYLSSRSIIKCNHFSSVKLYLCNLKNLSSNTSKNSKTFEEISHFWLKTFFWKWKTSQTELSNFTCCVSPQMGWSIPSGLRSIWWTSCRTTRPSSCPWEEWSGIVLCLSTVNFTWTSTTSRWRGRFSAATKDKSPYLLPLTLDVCVCVFAAFVWLSEWPADAGRVFISPAGSWALCSAASVSGADAHAFSVSQNGRRP